MDDQEFSYLKEKIHKLTGLDLNGYKSQQIRRRLEGFISRYADSDVMAYCRMLEHGQEKCRELIDFLAINVSEFFRDTHLFQYLKNTVLPELARRFNRINIWSAACSCGQEPYTMAMILEELPGAADKYRISATDIDDSALNKAKAGGPYLPGDVRNLEKYLLNKYFTKTGEEYWITENLKKRVYFKKHNLLSDPYDQGFDLIVCRNAIIYFSDTVREKLYKDFCMCLKAGGVLFIGGSEVILRPGELGFQILRPSFYRKLPVVKEAKLAVKS